DPDAARGRSPREAAQVDDAVRPGVEAAEPDQERATPDDLPGRLVEHDRSGHPSPAGQPRSGNRPTSVQASGSTVTGWTSLARVEIGRLGSLNRPGDDVTARS